MRHDLKKWTLCRHGPKTELLSLENLRALAGLEVKLFQTWSQHGPDMVPKIGNSIHIVVRPRKLSFENFRALVHL